MFKIFKKTKNYNYDEQIISKIASLLIHAAKIDENYTTEENNIIKKTLIELGANRDNVNSIISTAEQNEKNSNQMLDFTKEIKKLKKKKKEKIVECLWTIIYSDSESDMFESNLMRRLSGLLYLDKKTVGDIKEKVKNRIIK